MRRQKALSMFGLRGVVLAASAFALSLPAQAAGLNFLPPDLDYKSVCAVREVVKPELDRDWTQWHGEAVTVAPESLFAIAGEYLRGSERVAKSTFTAMALLDYLRKTGTVSQPRIDRLIGKALVADPAGPDDLKQGEARLLSAFAGGLVAAASDLANLYGADGPPQMRNPEQARRFYRIAAASGDTDGQLALARILAADPNASAAERDTATTNALLSMIQQVSRGNCRYMPIVATMYQRGELVPANVDTAIGWFEQYAKTGDARTEEKLGDLLTSRFVAKVDGTRAMQYLEDAALQGRSNAALTVGIAYATGTTRAPDTAAAEKFLTIAAQGSAAGADQWLAELYAGRFGSTPQPKLAVQHYEAALTKGATPDLEAEFGQYLANTPEVADPDRALDLFEKAAAEGSGQGAVLAGKLALARATVDPKAMLKADTYLRLGVELGKPEAARQLARMAACGMGVKADQAQAAMWTTRALYLGSTTALFDAAKAAIGSSDAATQAQGYALMKQAAYKGVPEALAYMIARLETGRGGYAADPGQAAILQRYIDTSADAAFRLDAALELIKARLSVAASDAEVSAQYDRLTALVETGSPEAAQLKADMMHEAGSTDSATLAALYAAAAQGGDKRAMRDYAQALQNSPATMSDGRAWMQKAADAGDLKSKILVVDLTAPGALQELANIKASGLACSADERIALARAFAHTGDPSGLKAAQELLVAAADVAGNDPDNLYKIADAYRDGIAGPELVADAEDFFARSAAAGKSQALRDVADGHLLGLWKDSSPDQARASLEALIQSGDPDAGSLMVRAIVNGQITASLDEVETLVAKSVSPGKAGDTYMQMVKLDAAGSFGSTHPDKQSEWLRKAAEAGNTSAMMQLYRAYASGIGVEVSATTAAEWLTRAAEGGDRRAAGELAAAYDVGFGVPVDPVKAAYWRDRASGAQG